MHAPLLALTLIAGLRHGIIAAGRRRRRHPFETIAVMSDSTGINLVPHVPIAVRNADDLADLEGIMGDGFSGDLPDRVMAAVEQVPTGMMPLVGIIDTSCGPPSTPGLSIDADGNVAMYALDPVPNQPECFVAVDTVAVLAVDPADVPIGAAGPAELLAFERLSGSVTGAPPAVELGPDATATLSAMVGADGDVPDLPPLVKGTRRFAFVTAGCQDATAELLVTRRFLQPRLYTDPVDLGIACAQAEFFLTVFDVPDSFVWPNAALGR